MFDDARLAIESGKSREKCEYLYDTCDFSLNRMMHKYMDYNDINGNPDTEYLKWWGTTKCSIIYKNAQINLDVLTYDVIRLGGQQKMTNDNSINNSRGWLWKMTYLTLESHLTNDRFEEEDVDFWDWSWFKFDVTQEDLLAKV